MYVCEDRVTRARVSVPILGYTYIHVYTRVYIVITCPSMKFPFHVRFGVSVGQWSKAPRLELRPVHTAVTWYRVGIPLYTLHARILGPTSSGFEYSGFKT